LQLHLRVLPGLLAIVRLPPECSIPDWALSAPFSSVTRTAGELSIVCAEELVPVDREGEGGWRAIMLVGPFEFTMTGVLAAVADPLARAGVPIFAVSTFDTDYILVKQSSLDRAQAVLEAGGHRFDSDEGDG
jgi:uncharacterized protein